MSLNPGAGIVPKPGSPFFRMFKQTLKMIVSFPRYFFSFLPAPGFQLTRTYSYGKWSKSWKILRGKRVRGAQKFPVIDFKDLLRGLWEVAWPDMAMVAYFHINWPNYSDNIPKASDQWPGFVDSYSHNVLRSSMFITQMKKLGIRLKGLHNYKRRLLSCIFKS